MKVQQFLITRFNVHIKSFDSDFNNGQWPGIDIAYLEKRFALFEQYCLPSIRGQSSDFEWLVFFSAQTPDVFKERILEYQKSFPRLNAIYLDDEQPLADGGIALIRNAVRCRISEDTQLCVTSRIDNDDAFSLYALERIKEIAISEYEKKRNSKFFISCVNGCVYDRIFGTLQKWSYKINHFNTLVCDVSKGIDTPTTYPHTSIYNVGIPIVEITDGCYWMEVVHGGNQLNELHPTLPFIRLDPEWIRATFGVSVEGFVYSDKEPLVLGLSAELQSAMKRIERFKSIPIISLLVGMRRICLSLARKIAGFKGA